MAGYCILERMFVHTTCIHGHFDDMYILCPFLTVAPFRDFPFPWSVLYIV